MQRKKTLHPRIEIDYVLFFIEAMRFAVIDHIFDRLARFFHRIAHRRSVNERNALVVTTTTPSEACTPAVPPTMTLNSL